MAIVIDATLLSKALREVAPLAKDRGIPILSCVMVEAKGDILTLTTTNLEQRITQTLAITEGEGSICVDAVRFSGVVSAFDDGAQVELDITSDQTSPIMTLKSGRSKFRFAGLPVMDFPPLPRTAGEMIKLTGDFREALSACRHAVSDNETQWHLRGIQLRSDGSVTAADGQRMARINLDRFGVEFFDTIIPTDAIDLISKLTEPMEMQIDQGRIWVESGSTIIASKTIDGKFPDLDSIIPRDDQMTMTAFIDRTTLLSAIARIMIVAQGKDRTIRLAFTKDCVTISNLSAGDHGTEDVPCECEGELEIGFNSAFLRDTLTALRGETVELGIVDRLRPVRIRSLPDEAMVLGPQRV